MRPGTRAALAVAAALASFASPPAASAAEDVIVRFRSGSEAGERAAARDAAGTELERTLPLAGMQLVDPEPGVSTGQAIERLERSEDVLYAEPDAMRAASRQPSDTYFHLQWGLENTGQAVANGDGTVDADVDMPAAWDDSTGSTALTVGVVDSGLDYRHRDLSPNIGRNPGETGGGRETNGVDDDSNGLVDDWRGWDWVQGDNDPQDPNGHGTKVAGILGARGNDNRGVAGVAWYAKLLPLRVLDPSGTGRVSDLVAAYRYAAQKRLPVVNASIAGPTFSQAEYDALRAASGTLFVVGSGNDSRNNDVTGSYPCNHSLPNVVCVTASDQDDVRPGFASYGRRSVELAAPGTNILSPVPGDRWSYMTGTSAATPHVAGAAALLLARYPGSTPAALRAALLSTVDRKPAFATTTVSGGRLNVDRALATRPSAAAFAPDAGVDPARVVVPPPVVTVPAPVARDATPPMLATRFRKRMRLGTLLRRGVRVRARCGETCTFRVNLALRRATAASITVVSRNVVVGKARGRVAGAGSKLVRLRLSARSRRLLRRVRPKRLSVRAAATDAAGNRVTLNRALKLVRVRR
jgi:subtilisin family serine protease